MTNIVGVADVWKGEISDNLIDVDYIIFNKAIHIKVIQRKYLYPEMIYRPFETV